MSLEISPSTLEIEKQQIDAEVDARRVQYATSLTRYLAICMVAVAAALLLLWLVSPAYPQFLLTSITALTSMAGSAVFPWFVRHGRPKTGMIVALVAFWLIMAVGGLALPAAFPAVSVGYVLMMIIGNLLLNTLPRRLYSALIGVGYLGTIILLNSGAAAWFPALESSISLLVGLLIGLIAIVLALFVIHVVVIGQEEQFRRAQAALLEISRRTVVEQQQRERLEQANQEIEQRAATEQQQRERLEQMVLQMREAASRLTAATTEIQAATVQQLASVTEQEATVAQTVSIVDEIRATVSQTADHARTVAATAGDSIEVSRAGQQAVNETVNGMQEIRQQVEAIAENILILSEHTQQIGEIIETVNDIAEQSKLLALNASIEAARAGEEGRGFAVVALEVRQLAEQSRAATARVRDILSEIQQATNTTVMVTEQGSKSANSGVTLVASAGEAITRLAMTIEEAAQAAEQIAASTGQQVNGMEQLATAMHSIRQASTQAAASTRQVETSAQQLLAMAQEMARSAV